MTGCVARQNFHLVMRGYSRVHDSHMTNLKFPPRHRSGWGETRSSVFRWVKGCSQGCCDCVCLGHTWSKWRTHHKETFAAWGRACNSCSVPVPQPSCFLSLTWECEYLHEHKAGDNWAFQIFWRSLHTAIRLFSVILGLITTTKKQVAEKVRVRIIWDCIGHSRVMRD